MTMTESRTTSKSVARQAELDEMRRLYVDEGLTLRQSGDRFGMTRQAMQLRFVVAGIARRSHYNQAFIDAKNERLERVARTVDENRDDIIRMYDVEKRPLSKVARQIGMSHGAIRSYLIRCGVEIRNRSSFRKFPELGELKVGESMLLPKQTRAYSPHLTYYCMAKTYKIRVSIRTVDEKTFRVTRVE